MRNGLGDRWYSHSYWTVFAIIFWTGCTVAIVALVSIYLTWLARRSVSHRFPLILAVAALVLMAAEKGLGENNGSAWSVLFTALLVMCLVTVGRSISTAARPKWMSLE